MLKQKPPDPIERRLAALKAAKAISAPLIASLKPAKKSRRAERQAAYRIVRVIIDDGSALRAVMRDISPEGARIHLEGAHILPPRITLKIDQTGEKKKASVIWQNEAEAGLAFDPPAH